MLAALEALIEDAIRGDPESPLRWVSRSQRNIAEALRRQGFEVSQKLVGPLLRDLKYGCQANRKTREGSSHPDRNAQFEDINATVKAAITAGEPAISVDTKKKELVGDFKNPGRELRPRGDPEQVRVHDFKIPELGKVAPYGVYDIAANQGWVNVGIDADTAAFAVESIRRWWERLGRARYPEASRLVITADCGGSNGARVRLWKRELQRFANETGLAVTVAHLPPGTSKWNGIEHRLFAYISQNWRGKPLVSHQVIIQLIGATTTKLASPSLATSTPAVIPRASRFPMPRWTPSTSNATRSMATGTIPSNPCQHSSHHDAVISRRILSLTVS